MYEWRMFVEGGRGRYGDNGYTEGCDAGMSWYGEKVVGELRKDPSRKQ